MWQMAASGVLALIASLVLTKLAFSILSELLLRLFD
jgi:hypothetical protein